MSFFKDLLKVRDPEKDGLSYSQSRTYLFITFLTTMVIVITGHDNFEQVTELLFYLIAVFSGYALTGKGMEHMKQVTKGYGDKSEIN